MKIKIYNTTWDVKMVTNETMLKSWNDNASEDDQFKKGDGVLAGLCRASTQTILISNKPIREHWRLTLIHELVHAIKYVSGDSQIEEYGEESLCEFVSCHYDEIDRIINMKKIKEML